MTLCKHEPHKIIDDIWAPRYSTQDVLINVNKINDTEHYILKFSKAPSLAGWHYLNRKDIVNRKTQGNGAGTMYIVPLSALQDFAPIPEKECGHAI